MREALVFASSTDIYCITSCKKLSLSSYVTISTHESYLNGLNIPTPCESLTGALVLFRQNVGVLAWVKADISSLVEYTLLS